MAKNAAKGHKNHWPSYCEVFGLRIGKAGGLGKDTV